MTETKEETRMTTTEFAQYREDTHRLLGSAVHLLQAYVEAGSENTIARRMADEWLAAYARYQGGSRALLPWEKS